MNKLTGRDVRIILRALLIIAVTVAVIYVAFRIMLALVLAPHALEVAQRWEDRK